MEKIKAVIFDLDQTLVYTLKRFYKVYNGTREYFSLNKMSWEEFYEKFEKDTLSEDIPSDIIDEFWRRFRREYCNHITSEDGPIEGAIEILRRLKEKNIIVIVTTGRECPPEIIRKELEYYGISEYVVDIYTLMMQEKDDEEILFERSGLLKRILRKYNLKPREVIFVGDYTPDMISGKRVGVITIGVSTGLKSPEILKENGAEYVFDSIKDLIWFLEKMGVI